MAEVLNSLGELATRTAASQQARDHHSQALAIARELGAPLEEARALEGIGRSYLQDGDSGAGNAQLRQALAIYQRIGVPDARRVQEPSAGMAPSPRADGSPFGGANWAVEPPSIARAAPVMKAVTAIGHAIPDP